MGRAEVFHRAPTNKVDIVITGQRIACRHGSAMSRVTLDSGQPTHVRT